MLMEAGVLASAAMFAFVTSITPGPNNAMLMASGMNFGFARTLPHMVGISLGFPVMLLAVGFGFGTLFRAYPALQVILEVVGGAYLLWLAWQIARAGAGDDLKPGSVKPLTVLQAAAFQWVNPKAWIIATGAIAVFLTPDKLALSLMTLALLYALINFPCIAVWAASGEAVGRFLKAPRQRRVFNYAMAGLLAASVVLPLITGTAHAKTPASEHSATARLPAMIDAYVREREFSGVISVWRGDRLILQRTVGQADRSFEVPVNRTTRFQLASISKLYVAAAVLRLVEKGQLNLADPIGNYVPKLHPTLASATIEDLLLHRSGLSRDARFDPWEELAIDTHVSRIGSEAIDHSRRGTYSYSNSGFVLLAKAVEAASGQDFERALQRELFGPFNLRDTGFIVGDQAVARLALGYARGPRGWRVPWRARHRGVYAPGGLYATVDDLARFFSSLRRGEVVSPASIQRLFAPVLDVDNGRQKAAFAGLWSKHNGRGYLLVAGSGDGAKTALMFAPQSGLMVIILSNNGDFPVNDMMRDAVLLLEGESPAPPSPCRIAEPRPLSAFVGAYDLSGSGFPAAEGRGTYEVSFGLDGNRAFLWDATDGSLMSLCERGDGQLRAMETDSVRVGFAQDGQGKQSMTLSIEGTTFRAERRPE